MEGRPKVEYRVPNLTDKAFSAASVRVRMARKGWSAGTRSSGDK